MDASTPVTPPTPEGNPIQDSVKGPEISGAQPTEPQAEGPQAKGTSVASPASAPQPPTRRTGPNASAIVVGVVAMVFAGLIIAKETMGLRLDWSRLGPGGIVSIGVLMVLIGAIGLVRRHDDV